MLTALDLAHFRAFAFLVLFLFQGAAAQELTSPPYDEVFGSATHNSYWVGHRYELGASGTEERILDQLLYDHVRALEFDIHRQTAQADAWPVYHTNQAENSLCATLEECLRQVQLFHYLLPQHEVINLVIELKEIWRHPFTYGHGVLALDAVLRQYLGDSLYTPRDFLSRCPPHTSLRECARRQGWPTVESLRGKFIINLLGNWNYNFNDWVEYATYGRGVIDRAAFPMRTIFNPHGPTRFFGFYARAQVDEHRLQVASEASVFWQLGDLGYAETPRFLAEHGVIRSMESQTPAEQQDRIARRFQLIQTDHPSSFVQANAAERLRGLPADAGRPRRRELLEPGSKIHLQSGQDGGPAAAMQLFSADLDEWETAPSTTRRPGGGSSGIGCLRAASSKKSQWFMVCREVTAAEQVRISVHVQPAGADKERVQTFAVLPGGGGNLGDLIALQVSRAAGRSCVQALSADKLRGQHPDWQRVASECLDGELDAQGLFALGDVLFFGTRHNQREVVAADLVPAKSR